MKFPMLWAVLVGLAGLSAHGDEYELYLLAGQSNMDGRGKAAKLSATQKKPIRNAIIFYRNPPTTTEGWKPLAPGFSVPPRFKGDLPSPTFGPELGFVTTLTESQPGRKFALIKGSKGGSSLRVDWNPGEAGKPETQGPRYRDMIETMAQARAALKNDGHTAILRGMIWHQGESDAKQSTENHEARLKRLIARIREDTGAPHLPVVLGQVVDNGKRDRVRAAILNASKADPLVGFVSSEGTTTWDEGTHFDAGSQLVLGERFAEEMLQLLDGANK